MNKIIQFNTTKIKTELGWQTDENFDSGIVKTVERYLKKFTPIKDQVIC